MSETQLRFRTFSQVQSREDVGELADGMERCITRAFGQEMPADEVADAFVAHFMVVALLGDQPVGFVTLGKKTAGNYTKGDLSAYPPETPRYSFGAGVVDAEFHGAGVYSQLNSYRLSHIISERGPLLTTTTQNPRVEKGIVRELEARVASGELSGYRLERGLLPSFYERRLTKDPLVTTGTAFEELDLEAGDAFTLVFHLSYPNR